MVENLHSPSFIVIENFLCVWHVLNSKIPYYLYLDFFFIAINPAIDWSIYHSI